MAEETGRRALGRGLAALIGDVDAEAFDPAPPRGPRRVPVEFLEPNPRNPRQSFPAEDLESLAASIRSKGIIQPILVRPAEGRPERYEIIAGERRWRAAQQAGLAEVPVVVREATDREALELAIVENVQRTDLNAIDEAGGYQRLIDQFGYSQADMAETIGKSRPHIANTLRLLKLPEPVQAHVREGRLTAGHARALLAAPDPVAAAERVIAGGLTVRATEALAARAEAAAPARSRQAAKDADTLALEKALSDGTGFTVAINHRASGAGDVRIRYETLEQLDEICRRLQAG